MLEGGAAGWAPTVLLFEEENSYIGREVGAEIGDRTGCRARARAGEKGRYKVSYGYG